jgi:hypothetical protein
MGSGKETWCTSECLDLDLEYLVFYIVEASSQEAVENYFTDICFAFRTTLKFDRKNQ